MSKIISLLLCIAFVLTLTSCTRMNEHGLAYTPDGSKSKSLIYSNEDYYTDFRSVYVIGGMMMCKIDGEPKMLEMALIEGDLSIDDILSAAEEDLADGDIECTEFPDGSREYHYDGFDIVKMNTHLGNRDVYFVPSEMGYADIQ